MGDILKVKGEKDIGALIISIIISVGVGIMSGVFAGITRISYENFSKPAFALPGWIFPIVWTILYFLMGIAAYRIWIAGKCGENVKRALFIYVFQLMLNFIWPLIFFKWDLKAVAFFELLMLIGFIIITILEFVKVDKKAAYLLIPYLLWSIFAAVLNYSIWMLNV